MIVITIPFAEVSHSAVCSGELENEEASIEIVGGSVCVLKRPLVRIIDRSFLPVGVGE